MPAAEAAPEPSPEPPGETSPEPARDPAELLEEAIDLYLDGRPAEARTALQGILALGPSLPADVREDALAYLGDVLYSEQGASAARGVFEALLAEAPAYVMDPFKHPPEVVRHFEALRRELAPDVTRPPLVRVSRDPYPWTIVLPGGAYYFKERKVIPGLSVAAVQLAAIGTTVWTRSEMLALPHLRTDPDGGISPGEDPNGAIARRYETLRILNLTTGIVGWAAYVVPVTVETIRWGADGRATVAVGPTRVQMSVSF